MVIFRSPWHKNHWRVCALMLSPGILAGCVTQQTHEQTEFQVRKLQTERDGLREQLNREKARSAALYSDLEDTKRNWAADQAELNMRRSHAEPRANPDEMAAAMQASDEELLKRPEVAPSPLSQRMDNALLDFSRAHASAVLYDRERGKIAMQSELLFGPDGEKIKPSAVSLMGDFVRAVKNELRDDSEVIVVARSESAGRQNLDAKTRSTNWSLAMQRALATKDALIDAGLPESRLVLMVLDPHRSAEQDPASTRRIDFYIAPIGEIVDRVSPRNSR